MVISDFGGVLTNPLVEAFRAYERHTGLTMSQLGEAMAAVAETDDLHPLYEIEKGTITEREFVEIMSQAVLSATGVEIRFDSFADIYFGALHANEPMLAYLRGLIGGHRLALLTNNVREWEPRWHAMIPVDEIFELVVDSGFVGTRKPEPEIYALTFERLRGLEGLGDLDPGECVLVDDIDVNCHGAERFGFRAIHFRNTEQAIAELGALLAR